MFSSMKAAVATFQTVFCPAVKNQTFGEWKFYSNRFSELTCRERRQCGLSLVTVEVSSSVNWKSANLQLTLSPGKRHGNVNIIVVFVSVGLFFLCQKVA